MGGRNMINSILPQYKAIIYALNPETGYFTKTVQQPDKTPVMRLPYELKIEPTQVSEIKCNADHLIRSKEKTAKGSFKFFTGLQDTNFKQWLSGNHCEFNKGQKILSLCLFHFADDNSGLTVFYFSRFYKEGREARDRLVNDLIPVLLKRQSS